MHFSLLHLLVVLLPSHLDLPTLVHRIQQLFFLKNARFHLLDFHLIDVVNWLTFHAIKGFEDIAGCVRIRIRIKLLPDFLLMGGQLPKFLRNVHFIAIHNRRPHRTQLFHALLEVDG